MKRYTLFIAAFAVAFSMIAGPAFSAVYVIPKLDLGYGLNEYHTGNDFGEDVNPMLGGGIIVGFNIMPAISIEGSIAYQWWFFDNDDVDVYTVPFMIGGRFGISNIGLLGGLGGVYRAVDTPGGELEDTVFGFYLGADIVVSNIMIRAQYVFAAEGDGDYEDSTHDYASHSIQVSVGYKFGI